MMFLAGILLIAVGSLILLVVKHPAMTFHKLMNLPAMYWMRNLHLVVPKRWAKMIGALYLAGAALCAVSAWAMVWKILG